MATIWQDSSPTAAKAATAINDVKAQIGAGSNFHLDASEATITFATLSGSDSVATQAAIDAANQFMAVYLFHIADTLAHKAAWAAPALVAATDLTSANTLANAIKADYANHIADTASHYNADATNTWTTTNATTLSTLQALLNAGKTKFNAHMASAPSAHSIRLVTG